MDRILANLEIWRLVKGKFPGNPGVKLDGIGISCKSTLKGKAELHIGHGSETGKEGRIALVEIDGDHIIVDAESVAT